MADEHRSIEDARRRRMGVEEALHRLERAFASPSDGRPGGWADGIGSALAELSDAWDHHVEGTEREGGLFSEVVEEAPWLAHRVDQLRDEHGAIGLDIVRVRDAAKITGDPSQGSEAVSGLQDETLQLMGRIVRHRHAGASLVYEAFSVDIQAAD